MLILFKKWYTVVDNSIKFLSISSLEYNNSCLDSSIYVRISLIGRNRMKRGNLCENSHFIGSWWK